MAMNVLSLAALLIAGLIHLLPVMGVLGVTSLQRLYGTTVADPNLAILLQHRAVLFGLLAALMLGALGVQAWRVMALAMGLVSTSSFVLIALWVGGYNGEIGRVVAVDVVVSVVLAAGLLAALVAGRSGV
ncbi:phosphopantetheine adenylyltransferase [Ideonella sp.]|jgi:hypothetical protein|uniref:phosphopantetheine adenylyltransferase n=1 Tax=Ideonella sp. TaxID=1929293 RepID=UPI0037BEEA69